MHLPHPSIESPSFWHTLPTSFRYPVSGDGIYILGGGAIFFSLLEFAGFLPIIGLVFALFGGAYLATFLLSVLTTSAHGAPVMPGWPMVSNIKEDVLQPALTLAATVAVSFSPVIAYTHFAADDMRTFDPWLVTLMVFSTAYCLIALLAVGLFDTLGGLSPTVVLPSILRVPIEILVLSLLVTGLAFLGNSTFDFLSARLGYLGGLFGQFIHVYLAAVAFRAAGLLYWTCRNVLNWK
jgi:hypothetical protein